MSAIIKEDSKSSKNSALISLFPANISSSPLRVLFRALRSLEEIEPFSCAKSLAGFSVLFFLLKNFIAIS